MGKLALGNRVKLRDQSMETGGASHKTRQKSDEGPKWTGLWIKGIREPKENLEIQEAEKQEYEKKEKNPYTHKTTLRVPHQAPGPRSCLELVDSEAPAH